MVLECFKENNETLHTTLTELYQSFIISRVDEHINFKKAVSLGKVLESDQIYFKSLSSVLADIPNVLSQEALETLFLLSKLAYMSYIQWYDKTNPKIIYTSRDLVHCNITNSASDACGLLKATNTLFATSNMAVYTFNHLSVQEYFCALYISLLPENRQLQLLKDHITHYPQLWPFYAGITKLKSSDALHYLCQLLSQYAQLEKNAVIYSNTSHVRGEPLIALNSLYEAQVTSNDCVYQLDSLCITGHSLSPRDYMSILYLISVAPITCLHLRGCNIKDQEAEMLSTRCKNLMPSLRVLNLSHNRITHKGMESLVKITNLTHLMVTVNPIGDAGIPILFSLEYIVQLNLICISMTEVGACALGKYFKVNSSLQSLDIGYNLIKDNGLSEMLKYLPCTLVRLIVSACRLTCNGAVNVGKMLRINKTLQHLDVSKNSIGDDGISSISDCLLVNTTLIQLVACSCEFHSEGVKSVAKMLQVNKTLKYLDISNNQIGDDGTTAIALAVQANTTLIQLNISCCGFCSQGAKDIAEVIRVNCTLKCLDISGNIVEDDELSDLAHNIKLNTTLIKLKISDTIDEIHQFRFTNDTLKKTERPHDSVCQNRIDIIYSGGKMNFEEWFIYDSGRRTARSYCIEDYSATSYSVGVPSNM